VQFKAPGYYWEIVFPLPKSNRKKDALFGFRKFADPAEL
jgi:hypothetical protein